jgi:hypothetical protein
MWGRPKYAPHLSKRRWTNVSRTHGPDEPVLAQGPGSAGARPREWPARGWSADEKARDGHSVEVRGKTYRLRSSEIQTLDGKNLIRHGLIAEKKIPHPETSPRRLLTLSKQGHQFLTVTKRVPKNQAIHYGFTEPREAHHDADLYRQGGRNLRVILDYELKKRVYHGLAKLGPHRESTAKKKEIAERHGQQVVRGKIPLPDLRIEYETREGEVARVDFELATEHYRGRNIAEKVRAGFLIYAHSQDAAGLRRVLDQRELTAEILSL